MADLDEDELLQRAREAMRGPGEEETTTDCPHCGPHPEFWPVTCDCCHGRRRVTESRALECERAQRPTGE